MGFLFAAEDPVPKTKNLKRQTMNYIDTNPAIPFGARDEDSAYQALLNIYIEAGLPDFAAAQSAAADCGDFFPRELSCAA